MTWSDEVHDSRVAAALAQSRSDRAFKAKGQRVPVSPDASPVQLLVLVGATASALLWKHNADRLRGVRWGQLPVLKQFHDLVFGSKGTKLGGPASASTQSKGKAKKNKKKAASAAASTSAPAQPSTPAPTPAPKASTTAATKEALKPSSIKVPSPTSTLPRQPSLSEGGDAAVPKQVVTSPAPLQASAVAPFLQSTSKVS